MMEKNTAVLLLAICLPSAQAVRDFIIPDRTYSGKYEFLWNAPKYENPRNYTIMRLITIMQTIYAKTDEKVASLHPIKFIYEKSKEFEEGYLMGEIIEKYRQVVEHVKITEKMMSYATYDLLLRMELVQKGYMEVYRLVNMMHEIPRKYGIDLKKFRPKIKRGDPEELTRAIKNLKMKDLKRKKQRRLRLKELKRIREVMQAGNSTMTPWTTKERKQWWKYSEYGWEPSEDYMADF